MRIAAEAGHADVQYNVGAVLAQHPDVASTAEAVRWWRAAAETEHSEAQYSLGCVLFGQGQPESLTEAETASVTSPPPNWSRARRSRR